MTIGTLDPVGLLGAAHRLVVEERDDRLAERHALDREEAVPAGVELVDDDVRVAVALERLGVMEALDDLEIGVEPLAGSDHEVGALPLPGGRRVDDQRPLTCATGSVGSILATSMPGGMTCASGTQRIAS